MEEMHKVFVRTDSAGRVTAINSSAFLRDTDGWQEIARGDGARYLHAQTRFLPLPLMDDRGVPRYRIEDGQPVLRDQSEMDDDASRIPQILGVRERLAALESFLDRLSAFLERLGWGGGAD